MKIMFLSGDLSHGGAQRVISVISGAMADRGYDVSLILFSRNNKEYPIHHGVRVFSICDSFMEYSKVSLINRIFTIRKLLRRIKPDIAVGFLEAGYALHVASIGMSIVKVASARIDPGIILIKRGLRAMLNRAWFRQAHAVILQTESQRTTAIMARWRNLIVIPNPVSEESLDLHEHIYDREFQKIIMVGRLTPQKNYTLALETMNTIHKAHPKIVLDIFGKGILEGILQKDIRDNGLDRMVTIRGWSQNIFDEYGKADLYILSSDYEGLPNALMEAMAAGLPCISTNCDTGPSDLIDDGLNGFLVPVGDKEALLNAILHVIRMTSQERRRMGEAAKKKLFERYTCDIIADQWESLVKDLKGRIRE